MPRNHDIGLINGLPEGEQGAAFAPLDFRNILLGVLAMLVLTINGYETVTIALNMLK